MTIKQYQVLRLVVSMLIAMTVSISVTMDNYLAPAIAVTVGLIVLTGARRKVKGVIADERDYSLAGQAARYSLSIFTILLLIGVFGCLAFRDATPELFNIAIFLAYLACALMIINSLVFRFLKARLADDKQNFSTRLKHYLPHFLLALILAFILVIATLRIFSPEDDWICQNGAWIQHGQPSAAMPTETCR